MEATTEEMVPLAAAVSLIRKLGLDRPALAAEGVLLYLHPSDDEERIAKAVIRTGARAVAAAEA